MDGIKLLIKEVEFAQAFSELSEPISVILDDAIVMVFFLVLWLHLHVACKVVRKGTVGTWT